VNGRESAWVRWGLRLATLATLAFIYVPLLVVVVYAFNASNIQSWPISGVSLRWFERAAADGSIRLAFLNSVIAASGATAIALLLGSMAAFAVQRYRFFGRETVSFLVILPIALPGVVTGVALSATFSTLDIPFGLVTIIIGHATFCVVIAYNNVLARLRRTVRSLEEASMDLGADTWQTFRHVFLPGMRTALLSGGLLAFALSFDEVIVTNFTAGAGIDTVPLWVLSAIQRPRDLPVVNVVALGLIVLSVLPVYLAQRISSEAVAVSR
jgi:putative spermidine/putrescine transport system permease protein